MSVSACILGCAGLTLARAERAFFADAEPWGFILFARNVDTPEQVRALVSSLREAVGRPAPVLIDQEGGRVQRLGPPHWRRYPPARALASAGREIVRLGARLLAHDLTALGVTVNCLPVLDVPGQGAHSAIGDRAYAGDPATVAVLGRAACEGLLAGGVLPVLKHIPGQGRATVDSHLEPPRVEASLGELDQCDFAPFRSLSDMPMAMTAHVIYAAIDDVRPATASRKVVRQVIRGTIGFDGLLISDDLSMQALSGDLRRRAEAARAAGCDLVLHCNGDRVEMNAVVTGAGALRGGGARRARAALARVPRTPEPFDAAEARARFDAALEGRWAA